MVGDGIKTYVPLCENENILCCITSQRNSDSRSHQVFSRYDPKLFFEIRNFTGSKRANQPGRVILSGFTSRSNSSAETKPSRTASSFKVVPRACADLATFAALS